MSNLKNILFLLDLLLLNIIVCEFGKDSKAYKEVPNGDLLKFRIGNGLGAYSGWDDAKVTKLAANVGYKGQRKKIPESHFATWGYGIEIDDSKYCNSVEIYDLVGYLHTPTSEHSSRPNTSVSTESYPPSNLYEPIWKSDGVTVNPDNYWANYIYNTVTNYKPYVKIWEVWNEPDYVGGNQQVVAGWETSPPSSSDLLSWHGTIFEYIRLLRITYEVVKSVDPTAYVATGGIGYPTFLDSILRYTDEPNGGAISSDYPLYGGAYFDCVAFHQYPQYGVTDSETGQKYDTMGSDSLSMRAAILKKNFVTVLKKYKFDGETYPKKIFVLTETGVASESLQGVVGRDEVRRNFVLKMPLRALEYDISKFISL